MSDLRRHAQTQTTRDGALSAASVRGQADGPLKIFHVVTRMNVGGVATYLLLHATSLQQKGQDTWLVTGEVEWNEKDLLRSLGEGVVFPFRLVRIPRLARTIHPLNDLIVLCQLTWLFLRERPDVVHTHISKAGILGRLAAFITRVPAILHTSHGIVFQGYFGRTGSGLIVKLERFANRFTDRTIALTTVGKMQLVEAGIASEDAIEVVPYGLDPGRYISAHKFRGELKQELGIPESARVLGAVARLVPIKAIEDLLQASSLVCGEFQDLHVVIVGDGELRPSLESLTRQLKMEARVHFLGFRSDIERLLADWDLFVQCSLNEGFGIAVVEAMFAGVPVISSAVGGVVDVVQDGINGTLFQAKDVAGLAERICLLLRNPSKGRRMAEYAKAQALERYSVERNSMTILGMYREILGVPMSGLIPSNTQQLTQ